MVEESVCLVKEDGFYYVLVEERDLSSRVCYPYNSENQEKQLINARDHGQERAKDLECLFKEDLDTNKG